ncbi:MAG: SAM-dependent methyltransferase [Victivallales bacterium]|nr:SAM-dependent methyltransferase [Victivallales bacterium]
MTESKVEEFLEEFFGGKVERLVLSSPIERNESVQRISIRRFTKGYQMERIIGTQAFHENLSLNDVQRVVQDNLGNVYRQFNGWNDSGEYTLSISSDGAVKCHRKRNQVARPFVEEHNRAKKRLLPENSIVPPLVDMGIFTEDGRLVPSKSDKYRQINRFLEFIDDVLTEDMHEKTFHVVDFGCGKSYLTFVVYYYLTVVKGMDVCMTGLDLKADVIAHCNQAAQKYGYSNLSFQVGDICAYDGEQDIDMVVTLHACDTATDYALAYAVKHHVNCILSVPCCQHELNGQMHSDNLSILCRYGIVQERIAALMTDALRANLLTACGYKTQVLEFIELSHTPKNLLIRAVKANLPADVRRRAWEEAQTLMAQFGFRPTLVEQLKPILPEFQ